MLDIKDALKMAIQGNGLNAEKLAILLETSVINIRAAINGTKQLPRRSELLAHSKLGISPYVILGIEEPPAEKAKERLTNVKASLSESVNVLINTIVDNGGSVKLSCDETETIDEMIAALSVLSKKLSSLLAAKREMENKQKHVEPAAFMYEVMTANGDTKRFAALSYRPSCGDKVIKRRPLVLHDVAPTVEFV